MIEVKRADSPTFAVFHTVYTNSNIFARFDWNDRVENAEECVADHGMFLYADGKLIGGFTLTDNKINYPFLIPPFDNRTEFWRIVLEYAVRISGRSEILLNEMPEEDAQILVRSYCAKIKWSKRKMLMPTGRHEPVLHDGFYFDSLAEEDKEQVFTVIHEAHTEGYTSTVAERDMGEIREAIEKRFVSFRQTNTLYMSNVVRNRESREIVGVCIAGIYPCSESYSTKNFAAIHQVSVKPEYRRKGIAKAMLLKSIHNANAISPVVILGVLVGNPAEKLYREIGFSEGPRYSELLYTV